MTRGAFGRFVEPSDAHIYAFVIVADTVLFLVAGLFYAGDFAFWVYPFSYLGAAFSTGGLDNSVARFIYAAAMLVSGAVLIARVIGTPGRASADTRLHAALTSVCGAGFVIAGLSPDDTQHRLHVLGSTMVVTALWLLATTTLYAVRIDLGPGRHGGAQLLLHVPILVYAALFFAGREAAAAIAQKPALLAIAAVLLYAASKVNPGKGSPTPPTDRPALTVRGNAGQGPRKTGARGHHRFGQTADRQVDGRAQR